MLVIRLFRVGKKNQPSFKIVVTDKRKPPRAGRFVEEVGFYNPITKEKILRQERIKYWLLVGAKPSDAVYNLLVSEKVIEGKKTPIYIKKKSSVAKDIDSEQKKEDVTSGVQAEEKKLTEETPKEEKEKPVPEKLAEEPHQDETSKEF